MALTFGCAEKKSDEPGMIDYLSGGVQLKMYKKTKSKLEDINKTLKERYQEIEK